MACSVMLEVSCSAAVIQESVSSFLRLPLLGKWRQYEDRPLQLFLHATLLQGLLQSLHPCLFAVPLPAPTFPSQCHSFSVAFQDTVWDAVDQLAHELCRHGNFQGRKDTALCTDRKHLFLSSWSPVFHFPSIVWAQEENVATSTRNRKAVGRSLPYSLWDTS